MSLITKWIIQQWPYALLDADRAFSKQLTQEHPIAVVTNCNLPQCSKILLIDACPARMLSSLNWEKPVQVFTQGRSRKIVFEARTTLFWRIK
jgi:hypothetical protein